MLLQLYFVFLFGERNIDFLSAVWLPSTSLVFYISLVLRVPSVCINNTCCYACVCLSAGSDPPACLPTCLPAPVLYGND